MKYRFFSIPATAPEAAQEALNAFCAGRRVVSVEKEFVQDAQRSYWAVCVCYVEGQEGPLAAGKRGKVDYREVLNEPDFAVFAKRRALRKELAEKEGIPAYAVLTNEQLADITQRRVQTVTALREIAGIGEARIEKYGDAFLRLLRAAWPASAANPPESSHET